MFIDNMFSKKGFIKRNLSQTVFYVIIGLIGFWLFWQGWISNNSRSKQTKEHEYYLFEKQITPSGKYVIYNYARGGMAFGSDISGTELFGIKDSFREKKGKKIDGRVSEWLSNDTLLVYNFPDLERPKDTLPIKIEYSKLGDFVVKTMFYNRNEFGNRILDFDSVATTGDSIFICAIKENKEKQILRFPLGGTSITTKSDTITNIAVSVRLNKRMDFTYKNEDGSFSSGFPAIGTTTYFLTPTKTILSEGLNKRKIFWREEHLRFGEGSALSE